MDVDSKPTEADFQSALLSEFGIDPPAVVTPPEPTSEDKPAGDEPKPAEHQEEVSKQDEPVIEPPKPDAPKEETVTQKALREAKEKYDAELAEIEKLEEKPADVEKPAEAVKTEDDAPKFATKDDVKEAMREFNDETTSRIERLNEAKKQVIDILHPEGIDRNLYDTNNVVIKTAQDIVDRGIFNSDTKEPYTYEEAASYILNAQKNIDLLESNERVVSKWGDILATLDDKTVQELRDEYLETQVEFDKTKQYIIKMSMSPERYYDRALAGYRTLNTALAEKAAAEAKAAAAEAAQKKEDDLAERDERNGTMPRQRASSTVKSNTGDQYLDALLDIM